MSKFWDWHIALGELIGSFILVAVILFSILISNQERFGLNTKWKKKSFLAATISSAVVVALTTSHMFGGNGFINPAVAMIAVVLTRQIKSFWYIAGFEMIGGILAALLVMITVSLHNTGLSKDKKVELSSVFKYNKQSIVRSQGAELLANITWLLPVAGLLLGVFHAPSSPFGNLGFTSVFQISMVAAIGVIIVILVFGEFGAANLNPAVWIGEFILKIYAQKSISPINLTKELLSVVNITAVGAICGGLAYVTTL